MFSRPVKFYIFVPFSCNYGDECFHSRLFTIGFHSHSSVKHCHKYNLNISWSGYNSMCIVSLPNLWKQVQTNTVLYEYSHRRRIELEDKAKVVASPLFGGQNPCRASCFASVYLEQTVEFNCLFQIDRLSSTVCSK